MKGNISESTIINRINTIVREAGLNPYTGCELLAKCQRELANNFFTAIGMVKTNLVTTTAKKTWSRAPKNKAVVAKKVDGRTRSAKTATTTANSATAAH